MKSAKEALLLSKLKKKTFESANTGPIGGDIPSANVGQVGGDIPSANSVPGQGLGVTANVGGAGDILRAAKIKDKGFQPHKMPEQYEAQVELGPTTVHSPIKDYLKGKKK